MKDRYPLASLLRVRLLHKKKAEDALFAAKDALKKAEAAYERCVANYTAYKEWRPKEEARRYQEIFGSTMTQEELDTFRSEIAALADEELAHEQRCSDAKKDVAACEDKVRAAQAGVRAAQAACQKLETHKEQWLEEDRKEAERASDAAMEDVHPPKLQMMTDDDFG